MTPQAHHAAAAVQEMLLDAGLGQDAELSRTLLAVGLLADLPVPAPTGQLAALLAAGTCDVPGNVPQGGDGAGSNPGNELGRRRLRAHRPTVVGLALVAGMGMGVGTVAASSDPAHTGSLSVQQLLEDWSPSWTIRTPLATAPEPLQAGGEGGNSHWPDHGGLAGTGTPAGGPQVTLQDTRDPWQASTVQPPGHVWENPGELATDDGGDGAKEPGTNGNTAEPDAGTGPHQSAPSDPGMSSGTAAAEADKSVHGPGGAPRPLAEAGYWAPGEPAGLAAGGKPVPGAKWLVKFVR